MLSLIITSPPSIQEKKKKSPFCISFPWMFSCSLLLNISEIAPNIFLLEFSQIWFLGFRVQCRSLITQSPGVSLLCPCWGSSFVNLLFVVQNPLRFHIKRYLRPGTTDSGIDSLLTTINPEQNKILSVCHV